MSELIAIGGIQPLMKMLLDDGLLHGDCLTVTGKTMAQNLKIGEAVSEGPGHRSSVRQSDQTGQPSRHPVRQPRPDGAVAKITGKEGLHFTGTRRVFDTEEDVLAADPRRQVEEGDVIVIRYEGPKGGPGMREMLPPDQRHHGHGLRQESPDHRRPLLRRQPRLRRRPHHARSRRRPDRAGARTATRSPSMRRRAKSAST